MSDPFLGEIRMFGGSFAPVNWAFCDGRTLQISQNDALFNLLGTTYGGDGQATFNLPDLRGRIPINMGQGPKLSNYQLGQMGGAENVTLSVTELPSHSHTMVASLDAATQAGPSGAYVAQTTAQTYIPAPAVAAMASGSVGISGNSIPHENLMPFTCISFIICLSGIFPSRN
jgi:microcystin-dependent protein